MSTRRAGVIRTSLGMQTIGLAIYAAALVAFGQWPALSWEQLPYAVALALLGTSSLALLYRAFATGPIAVVSPIVASYAALTVLLIVVFLGERLTAGQAAAIAATFVGVVIASTDVRELRRTLGKPSEGVRIGLMATVGFSLWGLVFAMGTRATEPLALIVLLRACSIVLLTALVLVRRVSVAPLASASALGLVTIVGIFDTGANVLMGLGIDRGYASFVLTGSGAYPLIPALLAILVLRERLAPNQYLGVAILIAGLVALGLQS